MSKKLKKILLSAGEEYIIENITKTDLFYSDKPSIANVDKNGTIQAISKGEAIITVKRNNQKEEIKIIVKDNEIKYFDIKNEEHINWYGRFYNIKIITVKYIYEIL